MSQIEKLSIFLHESKLSYSALGIDISNRQRPVKFWDYLISLIDLLKFTFMRPRHKHLLVASLMHLKPHSACKAIASINYFDDYLGADTIVIYRNTAKGTYNRYKNAYDLTLVYALAKFLSLPFKHHKRVLVELTLLSFFWKLLNVEPDIIFIADWNNSFSSSFILSGKKRCIPVIEMQHGVIHHRHPAYNSLDDLSTMIKCDELLYWHLPDDANFLDNLYPPNNRTKINLPLLHAKKRHAIGQGFIVVALQDSNQHNFFPFIEELINNSKMDGLKFGLKPRRNSELSTKVASLYPGRVFIMNGPFCEVLKRADVVISHSSTALIDAYLADVKAICFDFDGTASERNYPVISLVKSGKIKYANNIKVVLKHLRGDF